MQVASALASVEVAEFQPKQGYTIPTESTDGESKPAAAATDDHEVIKSLADKLKVCPTLNRISDINPSTKTAASFPPACDL